MKRQSWKPIQVLAVALLFGLLAGPVIAQGDAELGGPGDELEREGAWAPCAGPGRVMPSPRALRFLLGNLNLSESQREDIRRIFESEQDQVLAYHERLRALAGDLHEQIEDDPYDEEAVRAKAAAVAALRVERAVVWARRSGQLRDVLTPEQLDEMEQMKEKRRALQNERRRRFEQRRGRRLRP